ncbi:MAG: malectin domain-containing carbohydrate-binding protein [Desulfobacteraceae bacterium]
MKTHVKQHHYFYFAIFTFIFVLSLTVESSEAAITLPGGIDTGASTSYTTTNGITFEADNSRTGGIVRTSSGEIAGTEDDTLYHTRAVAQTGDDVTYQISPPQGVTEMRIIGHFNEHYHQTEDARLIDVWIECPGSAEPWNTGQLVEEGLDIFAAAGGANTALVRDWGTVDVSGGEILITISANSASPDAALISAIEFAPLITAPSISLPGGIDTGASTSYTNAQGVTFEADNGRTGGILRTSSGEIAGTDDDTLYHTRAVARTGDNVTYQISPPQGATEMQIIGHFNEHYHQTENARLIDVRIECPGSVEPWNTGQLVEDGLDIFAEAGGANTALVRDWGTVDVSGGEVLITISANSASPDAALISAIEFAATGVQGNCQAPVLDPIGDIWVEFLDANEFIITASDPDTDDGDLTFEAYRHPDSNPIVNACYFDSETRIYSCEMREGQAWGSHQEVFRVCDDCTPEPLCDEEVVTVTSFIGKNYLVNHTYYNAAGNSVGGPSNIDMEFADAAHSQIALHVVSPCNDTQCEYGTYDWGTAVADYDGPNPMQFIYEFEWGTVTLTIDPLKANADEVLLEEYRDYNDGREDTTKFYDFWI